MDKDVSYHNQFATENSPRKVLQEIKKVTAMPNQNLKFLMKNFSQKKFVALPNTLLNLKNKSLSSSTQILSSLSNFFKKKWQQKSAFSDP